MSTKLSDKFIPVFAMVGLVYASNEVWQEGINGKNIDGKFIGLALGSGMSQTDVLFNCRFLDRFVSR